LYYIYIVCTINRLYIHSSICLKTYVFIYMKDYQVQKRLTIYIICYQFLRLLSILHTYIHIYKDIYCSKYIRYMCNMPSLGWIRSDIDLSDNKGSTPYSNNGRSLTLPPLSSTIPRKVGNWRRDAKCQILYHIIARMYHA
jgi:hypothetical protein